MKTIMELRTEGKLSTRMFNIIARNAVSDINYLMKYKRLNRVCYGVELDEVVNMSINDLFDLFGEDRIRHWRGLGPKGLEELKGLI